LLFGQRLEQLLHLRERQVVEGFRLDIATSLQQIGVQFDLGHAASGRPTRVDESPVRYDEDPRPKRLLGSGEAVDRSCDVEKGLGGEIFRLVGATQREVAGDRWRIGPEDALPRPGLTLLGGLQQVCECVGHLHIAIDLWNGNLKRFGSNPYPRAPNLRLLVQNRAFSGWDENRRRILRNRLIVLTLIAGLVAISGVASAATSEERGDTVFNFSYDEEADVLLWNTTTNDGLYDCSLQRDGALKTTYDVSGDDVVHVVDLTDDADKAVIFPARSQDEVAEGLTAAQEDVEYTGPDGECGVSGAKVAGPNGQINHGMFMKLVNSLFDSHSKGCLNRYVAQSSLGKGEQQVQVSDVDPDSVAVADGDTGVVEFQTEIADCTHGGDKVTGQDRAAEHRAAKTDRPRGKSDQAPGRNK
jgi:hypothetical protein